MTMINNKASWNYVHSIENKILVKIKPKRDTRLQQKSSRARFFLQPWSKFPPFFILGGGLNGLNF